MEGAKLKTMDGFLGEMMEVVAMTIPGLWG